MTKVTLTVTLDDNLVKKARRRQLNMSGTINTLLADFLAHDDAVERLVIERQRTQKLLASLDGKIRQLQEADEKTLLSDQEREDKHNNERIKDLETKIARISHWIKTKKTPSGQVFSSKDIKRFKKERAEVKDLIKTLGGGKK